MNNIQKMRKKAGLTQDELGKMLHVTQTTISLYESEKRSLDIYTAKAIAKVLNVSIDELFPDWAKKDSLIKQIRLQEKTV